MLQKINSKQIYTGNYGWHTGHFHFSFGDYADPGNTHFGDLIAFNDFFLSPESGFDTHPHQEIEIISYCVEGEMVHKDSMGNKNIITHGGMQYTCAGSGITHSEYNYSLEKDLRFVQIWIRPALSNLSPNYASTQIVRSDRLNKLLQIVSGHRIENVTRINQDANIFVSEIEPGARLQLNQHSDRQFYLSCLEGALSVNDTSLEHGDAIKIWDEGTVILDAVHNCHLLMVDVPRIAIR